MLLHGGQVVSQFGTKSLSQKVVQSLRFKTSKRRARDCVYGRSPFYTVPSRPEVRELLLTSDRGPLENGMIRRPTTPGPMPPSATRLRLASLALVMGILIDCGNAGWPSSDAEYGTPGSEGELVTCGISLIVSS